MDSKLIFVVDDEPHICELISYNLQKEGYSVNVFGSGEEMILGLKHNTPQMFILDIMLPGLDGLELCRIIRNNEKAKQIPIIMLTAKGEEIDKIVGLEMGADDYLTKPFSIRELITRVKVIFRRVYAISSEKILDDVLKIRDIEIDIKKREVRKEGQKLQLTFKEFELLKIFAQNRGNVLSRDVLLDKVWGYEYGGETRTVDVHIRNLRKSIGDIEENYIETVRGIGYKLKE